MSWNYTDFKKWIEAGCDDDVAKTVRKLTSVVIAVQGGLTTLDDSISRLTNLRILDLSNNYLTTLPDSLSALTNLRILYLSGNRLESLVPIGSISGLLKLHTRYLSRNRLTTLPDSILGC